MRDDGIRDAIERELITDYDDDDDDDDKMLEDHEELSKRCTPIRAEHAQFH